MKKKFFPTLGLLGVLGLVAPTAVDINPAYSAPTQAPTQATTPVDDTVQASEIVQRGELPVVDLGDAAAAQAAPADPSLNIQAAIADPVVGETRNWLALDDVGGFYYRKGFTLKALNDKTEIWVASEKRPAPTRGTAVGESTGTGFLDGDCRNDRTEVTEQQAQYLASEFQNNMLPKESAAFSVAPDRDGTKAIVPAPLYNPQGPGQRTVVLVDNVRDDNFYDKNNTKGGSFIAGFFSSQLNGFFDRNIMTIDGFDWLHRTGANPPNEPVPGDLCKSAPARPFAYEGVFAHEYQHLLQSYADNDEFTWVNEGLSDWAETLTGYVNTRIPVTEIGFESHTQCFLGGLSIPTPANPTPRANSGPENSLTRWEDQGPGEILCDYGAVYTFMNYVHGQYGNEFMKLLHNNKGNGYIGVQEALTAIGDKKTTPIDLMHNWALTVAVDGYLDEDADLSGDYRRRKLQTPELNAKINWDTPDAYSTPGAPSNGSDYVRLRGADGKYLAGKDIKSLSFEGATTLPPTPLEWTLDPNPPGQEGDPALYSGTGDNRDEFATLDIPVGLGAEAILNFDAYWDLEEGWDFGYIQISTDQGATYKTFPCTDTTDKTDPDAIEVVKQNVPGFTGFSGGWRKQQCDLSKYAGYEVSMGLRIINDPAAQGNDPARKPGFWIDNMLIGTRWIADGSTLGAFRSLTQTKPVTVDNFFVNIISVESDDGKGKGSDGPRVTVRRIPLTEDFKVKGDKEVKKYVEKDADLVAAIITYDDPTERVTQYAPYKLTVNEVVQPGGGMG